MNKAQLVAALADRVGDRAAAASTVDELLDVIVRAVQAGDSVSITGFGVFERRERAARTARNPRTGQAVKVAATKVPAFRPGAGFRDVVSGARALPAAGSAAAPAAAPRATATRASRTPAAKPAARTARAAATPKPVAPAATAPPPKDTAKSKPKAKGSDKKSGKAKGGKKKK